MDEVMKLMMDTALEAEIMGEAENALTAFEIAYPAVRRINTPEIFGAFLGILVDQWACDHDISSEDIRTLVSTLSVVQGPVHEAMGLGKKTITA